MKKIHLLLLLCLSVSGFGQTGNIRLGLISPTPHNLERIEYLIENKMIQIENLEIVGIFHASQAALMEAVKESASERSYSNFSLFTIEGSIHIDSLFIENRCTRDFIELFSVTDGILFLGGPDIPPVLYGENTFLTTEIMPLERLWELSLMFHLTGGSQNREWIPLLEKRPGYVVLGICLGMQMMSVAGGGSMVQDIPYQIYQKSSFESIMEMEPDNQHKNYRYKIDNWSENTTLFHFHRIRVVQGGNLDFGSGLLTPRVTSVHHQAIRELGANLKVAATSMDQKVIESIENIRYPNVYGVQFHPEFSIIYKQPEFETLYGNGAVLKEDDRNFHRLFWRDFSKRFVIQN
jgi:putative glutamine amidotransferase